MKAKELVHEVINDSNDDGSKVADAADGTGFGWPVLWSPEYASICKAPGDMNGSYVDD